MLVHLPNNNQLVLQWPKFKDCLREAYGPGYYSNPSFANNMLTLALSNPGQIYCMYGWTGDEVTENADVIGVFEKRYNPADERTEFCMLAIQSYTKLQRSNWKKLGDELLSFAKSVGCDLLTWYSHNPNTTLFLDTLFGEREREVMQFARISVR